MRSFLFVVSWGNRRKYAEIMKSGKKFMCRSGVFMCRLVVFGYPNCYRHRPASFAPLFYLQNNCILASGLTAAGGTLKLLPDHSRITSTGTKVIQK